MLQESNGKVERRPSCLSKNLNKHEAQEHSSSWSPEMLLRGLKAIKARQDDKFAQVLDAAGEFGAFQRRLVVLTFIPNTLLAFFTFADFFVFTAQKPYCNTSWILAVGPNLTEAEQMNLTLPREPDGSFQTCIMYLPVAWDLDSIIQFGLNHTDSCQDGWVYPDTKKRSLINEFDLVCGKEQSSETVQTILTTGLLLGSLLFGLISDKLGRYPSILMSLLGLIVFGFGTAFVNTFHQYLFFRFGVSQALVGYTISSVSLATEWLVAEHRAHAIILEHCFFSVGVMFLTGLAYSLPHWRLLFLVGGVPVFPLISYIWALPESPRWLLIKGKLDEAKQTLCYAADVNKKTIPESLLDKLPMPGKRVMKTSILDFYSNKHLRRMTLVMGCVWFTVGYSYFTLYLKLKNLDVSTHFRHVIPRVLEMPARLCCIFLLEQMGRKWSLFATLFQGALMCLLSLLPSELKSIMVLTVTLGEFSLAASTTVSFIYTAELLPTVLRATGLGLMFMAWAAGAILSLMIIDQTPSLLPILVCCISAVLALFLCALLPETEDRPLLDVLEQYPRQASCLFRTMAEKLLAEDAAHTDGPQDVVRNTILNSLILKLDSDILAASSLQGRAEDTEPQSG